MIIRRVHIVDKLYMNRACYADASVWLPLQNVLSVAFRPQPTCSLVYQKSVQWRNVAPESQSGYGAYQEAPYSMGVATPCFWLNICHRLTCLMGGQSVHLCSISLSGDKRANRAAAPWTYVPANFFSPPGLGRLLGYNAKYTAAL